MTPEPELPAEYKADAETIYRRLKGLGDHYAAIAEKETEAGATQPSAALWAALKCWKEALTVVYRTGRLAEPPIVDDDPFEAYQKAKRTRTS